MLIWDQRVVHGSTPNRSDSIRAAIPIRAYRADILRGCPMRARNRAQVITEKLVGFEDELTERFALDEDNRHQLHGARALKDLLPEKVVACVGGHVAAKRYLCTTDTAYCDKLSPTSLKSFHDQGGMMSDAELDEFRANPFFEDAVRLRRWDDTAKIADLKTEAVEHFVPLLQRSLIGDHL